VTLRYVIYRSVEKILPPVSVTDYNAADVIRYPAEKSHVSTEVAESNTLWMKHRHAHVTVERRRYTKPTNTVHTTHFLCPHADTAAHQQTQQRYQHTISVVLGTSTSVLCHKVHVVRMPNVFCRVWHPNHMNLVRLEKCFKHATVFILSVCTSTSM